MPSPKLSESQRRHLDVLFGFCSKVHELRRLSLRFGAMLRWRRAKKLNNWIDSAAAGSIGGGRWNCRVTSLPLQHFRAGGLKSSTYSTRLAESAAGSGTRPALRLSWRKSLPFISTKVHISIRRDRIRSPIRSPSVSPRRPPAPGARAG